MMSFLKNLFGKKETAKETAEETAIVMTAVEIEKKLRAHLAYVEYTSRSRPGYKELYDMSKPLQSDEQLAFVVKSIHKNLPLALANKARYDGTQVFTGIEKSSYFVAVTVFPWLKPAEILSHIPGGYSKLMVELGAKVAILDNRSPSEAELGILPWTHLVHWIYCCDGEWAKVHMSFISEAAKPQAKRSVIIVAEDLLTPTERKQMELSYMDNNSSTVEKGNNSISGKKEIDQNKCTVCEKGLNFQRKFGGVMFGDAYQEALMRMAYKCRSCGTPICRECAEKSRCPECGGNTFDVDLERIK
jgi:hypothetical protein